VTKTVRTIDKDKLGFKINIIWKNPAYGSVKRGNVFIEFGEARKEHAGSGVCYIHVDNAANIYNEFKTKDLEFVGDFADRDYGCRDFRVKDNNGNILIIGHALKNKKELLHKGNVA
jgi:hypothetical protein